MSALPRAYGAPVAHARLRVLPEDFEVVEELGYVPGAEGGHQWLWVEKRAANTAWVAERLAAYAGCRVAEVGYAGSKDRHAVVRQWFSVPRLGVDWSALAVPGVRVLDARRMPHKLRRGALRGNRFRLVLRDVQGDRAAIERRIVLMGAHGVPNYFGPQRFGRAGGNLRRAEVLGADGKLARRTRGFALSAARAEVFNAVLARRIDNGSWALGLPGEVWMLDGRRSIFGPEAASLELAERARRAQIHPTGPLWGRGVLRTGGVIARWEVEVAARYAAFCQLLERAGLEQERRALRAPVRALRDHWIDGKTLCLEFHLAAGQYATAVLRELLDEPSDASVTEEE